ncbi:MAG: type II toxin-antitoxin system mRNA interferase toxin, RelE/StbE family [Candidatus Levybacteria bacterium]|nr:type II toxin-antitoxin system mRNA interferase toxin, RelE/StbE family [Candidatus Levybacteria bacterium]
MKKEESSPRIEFSDLFNIQRKAAPLHIKIAFREALELFLEDPENSALRNHSLTGKYAGIRSIDVTVDWRALFREEAERIIFVELGTHTRLYGK